MPEHYVTHIAGKKGHVQEVVTQERFDALERTGQLVGIHPLTDAPPALGTEKSEAKGRG